MFGSQMDLMVKSNVKNVSESCLEELSRVWC